MKPNHRKRERHSTPSPAAQLQNVIDAVCDERLEIEILAEDQQNAPPKYPHIEHYEISGAPGMLPSDTSDLKISEAKAELLQFASSYAKKLEAQRASMDEKEVIEETDAIDAEGVIDRVQTINSPGKN